MAEFNFDRFAQEHEHRVMLRSVCDTLTNLEVGGQRVVPQGEGTPLHLLTNYLQRGQEDVPEVFDFELGEVLTLEHATEQCAEHHVNLPDMVNQTGNRLYFNVNLDRDEPAWQEISKPENAHPLVEYACCRFLDNGKTVIDWKNTLPELKKLAKERKYTPEMVMVCLKKLVHDHCRVHTHMVEDLNINEVANYLISIERNMDRNQYRRKELGELKREPGQELRIPLTMARKLIDRIYPEAVAENASARSESWRTAIISFSPDNVSIPLIKRIKKQIEDCTPMTDEQIHAFALDADRFQKAVVTKPLQFGRTIGTEAAKAQVQFNYMDNGWGTFGVPLEGYTDPYQTYMAYPPTPNQRPQPPAPQVLPILPIGMGQPLVQGANPELDATRMALAVANRQLAMAAHMLGGQPPNQAGASLTAGTHQQQAAKPADDANLQQVGLRTPSNLGGIQPPVTPQRVQGQNEVMTPVPSGSREVMSDSVRRNLVAAGQQTDGSSGGASGTIHDLDPRGHGSGVTTRQMARSSNQDRSDGGQQELNTMCLDLFAVTLDKVLTKVMTNKEPAQDQSYTRGQVQDGRYRSRDRAQNNSEAGSTSRNGGRERSRSGARSPWSFRGPQRDPPYPSDRSSTSKREASRSPGRNGRNGEKSTSDSRTGRSDSRSSGSRRTRNNSGYLRTIYPEMRDGENCRRGYDPLEEKHCTKCYPTANHHEFLCTEYKLYCAGLCSTCGKSHHFSHECKNSKDTFPPKVGESQSVKLAKN
jgi:xanthosine utilization system XapX-like protein